MNGFRKISAALALGLALAAAATPALAKHRTAAHPGYAARAQAPADDGGLITSGPRSHALRECNDQAAPLRDYTWGMEQTDRYRACMSEHGQPE